MGHGYSADLRVRIYGDIEQGSSRRAAARRFGVSASTSIRLAQRMKETSSLEPARQGRPPGGKLVSHGERLIGWVEAQGDITMPELAAKLKAECGVTVHPASLSRFLLTRGFTVMCGRPLRCKWKMRSGLAMWSGAVMCPASVKRC